MNDDVVIGGTYLWSPTFSKDGAVYDITGATVTITFHKPRARGVVASYVSFSMTITSGTEGLATYQNLTTLIDRDGQWEVSYKVVKGSDENESRPIAFTVYPSLAALAA